MKYFVKITSTYSTKNRLQEMIRKRCEVYDQMMVETPEEFGRLMERIVRASNEKWPRCAAEQIRLGNPGKDSPNQRTLDIGHKPGKFGEYYCIMIFTIYTVTGELDMTKREIHPAQSAGDTLTLKF